jgi:hypothetical protein
MKQIMREKPDLDERIRVLGKKDSWIHDKEKTKMVIEDLLFGNKRGYMNIQDAT